MPDTVSLTNADGTASNVIAYLAEVHSLSGFSGSPAYFTYPMVVQEQTKVGGVDVSTGVHLAWIHGGLGLISGHFEIATEAETSGGDIQVQHNSGIAIVTPADAIRRLLMRNDVADARVAAERA